MKSVPLLHAIFHFFSVIAEVISPLVHRGTGLSATLKQNEHMIGIWTTIIIVSELH